MLRGEHVGLRSIEPGDLEQLREWRNRPDFRQYFREHREIGPDNQRRWYETRVVGDPSTIMFAVVDLGSGDLLGATGLCFIDWVNRNCDLSIYLGADGIYIDDRLAPDAARVTLGYGFDVLGMHRIWAEIYDFDEPKKRLFDELGLTLDGRHREHHFHDGAWHDSLFYAILERDYRARS